MYEEFRRVLKYFEDINIDWNALEPPTLIGKRKAGYQFTLRDYCEAWVLTLLSANRPWYQVEQHLPELRVALKDYDPEYLCNESPEVLCSKIKDLHCVNKRLATQMSELKYNISKLKLVTEVGKGDCKLPGGFTLGDTFSTPGKVDVSRMFLCCTFPEGFTLGTKFDITHAVFLESMFNNCWGLEDIRRNSVEELVEWLKYNKVKYPEEPDPDAYVMPAPVDMSRCD